MKLKNLLGAFVEFEEKPVEIKPFTEKESVSEVKVINNLNFNTFQTQPQIDNSQVTQFKNTFKSILEDENKRNFPGNDFFEFWQMKNSMNNIISQEDIRYGSAFATWNVSSKNPQDKTKLLDTAKTYLGLIEKEIESFKQAYNSEFNQQVTSNNNLIAQKTKEMGEIAEKLRILDSEVKSLNTANSTKTQDLTQKYESFMIAGNEQKEEIINEMTKINQYIN